MKNTVQESCLVKKSGSKGSFWKYIRWNYDLYLLLVPGILLIIIFNYIPLYGLTIAFKDFNIFAGANPMDAIFKSPWVGFKHFKRLIESPEFMQVFRNTLLISIYKLFFLFPLPIILAILTNEIGNKYFKKTFQTIVYLPHFLSWVIVSGLFVTILGNTGIVNMVLQKFGLEEPISFFMSTAWFRPILVFTEAWKSSGWSTIVYLSAITAIDTELYDAASVDGANKFQRILNVTLPGLTPTIVLLLIMRVGHILDAGFEQILVMYNPLVYEVGDILQTYVYRIGLGQMDYSMATAVGLFNSLVAFILITTCNRISKKTVGRSIW